MSTYIFTLGKDRDLSIAELYARYPEAKFSAMGEDFAVLDMEQKIDQSEFDRLGGVIKVGLVAGDADKDNLQEMLMGILMKHLPEGKLNYGISVYGWSERNLKPLLLELKKRLKSDGVSSRFANQDFKNISTAQHKGLGKKGIELVVAKDGEKFMISEVVAVQDIDSYSMRDYDKPYRDMKVGMLPPKLAQIMINLTGSAGTIWDPFCGGGVLITEGMLMGHDMIGSDIDPKILEGAKRNAEWIKREFGIKKDAILFLNDATKPLTGRKFDAIAAEGYLGPPQARLRTPDALRGLVSELDKLYIKFFSALKKSGFAGPIVIAMPFFRTTSEELDLGDTVNQIVQIGFELTPLLPKEAGEALYLKYARPDQIVGRMIFRLRC
jgi:tRNA G10  N-methylase Trm11